MFFIYFILIGAVVYIGSFKESFSQEHVSKVGGIAVIALIAVVVISIVAGILSN